jgi:hypothetical protein
MDMRSIIASVVKVADMASTFIPQAKLISGGAELGGQIIDLIDGLHDHADPAQQAEMQAARKKLSDAVKAKAAATSARLRG